MLEITASAGRRISRRFAAAAARYLARHGCDLDAPYRLLVHREMSAARLAAMPSSPLSRGG
jgi:hypothetical protein